MASKGLYHVCEWRLQTSYDDSGLYLDVHLTFFSLSPLLCPVIEYWTLLSGNAQLSILTRLQLIEWFYQSVTSNWLTRSPLSPPTHDSASHSPPPNSVWFLVLELSANENVAAEVANTSCACWSGWSKKQYDVLCRCHCVHMVAVYFRLVRVVYVVCTVYDAV